MKLNYITWKDIWYYDIDVYRETDLLCYNKSICHYIEYKAFHRQYIRINFSSSSNKKDVFYSKIDNDNYKIIENLLSVFSKGNVIILYDNSILLAMKRCLKGLNNLACGAYKGFAGWFALNTSYEWRPAELAACAASF